MKFGETFMDYLHGGQEIKCSHVEYKRLKKVLKSCRACRVLKDSCSSSGQGDNFCQYEACPLCDQMFFSELLKEASDISGCFSSRVRHLLHLHIATGMQRYLLYLCQCFTNNQQAMVQESRMLIEYVTMNAIAMRKILKKYDKVHSSVNGRNFKSKMRAEHTEILQSPWLIELGAFYMNFNEANGESGELFSPFSCDLSTREPLITFMLPDSVKLEYSLTCAVCLVRSYFLLHFRGKSGNFEHNFFLQFASHLFDTLSLTSSWWLSSIHQDLVFNPYALNCGHIFCKSCACSAASVMIFQGLKAASPESKCPVCREAGVYTNAIHMLELDLLLKKRRKEYWKERLITERAEASKQSKEYWDLQTKYLVG